MLHEKPEHRIRFELHSERLKELIEKEKITLSLPARTHNLPVGTAIQFTPEIYGVITEKKFVSIDRKLFYEYQIVKEQKGEKQ